MTNTRELAQKLLKGCEGVTPGPWVAGSEKSEGSYGSGEDNYEGYHTSQLLDAKGLKIADALNSDVGMVNEDFDDEGWCYAWDEQAEKNFAHIANCDPTSIRTLATAHLTLLDEVERLKKVLAAIDTYEIDARSSMVNNVYTLKNIARNARSNKEGA